MKINTLPTSKKYICCFGEVLWDDFPTGRVLGGAPMNVAAGLQNLGISATMISRIGADDLGNQIIDFFKARGLTTEGVQTDLAHETGIVKVTASATGENHYEIVQPIAWDFIETTENNKNLVQNAYAFVFGSLSCRNATSRSTLLALLTIADNTLKVFDVNFRPPFYEQTLIENLLLCADIVKMNDEELNIIATWYNLNLLSDGEKMNYLKQQFGLKMLVVTRGANGAILLNDAGLHESDGFRVQVKDTVGSGDAFLAGLLKGLEEGKTPEDALSFGCAFGALVATQAGATPLIQRVMIDDFMNCLV